MASGDDTVGCAPMLSLGYEVLRAAHAGKKCGRGSASITLTYMALPIFCDPMDAAQVQARAQLSLAQGVRDLADHARGVVGDVLVPMTAGERIRSVRELRIIAQAMVDRTVILEALSGSTWAEIADAFGLPDGELKRRYGSTVDMWRAGQPVNDFTTSIAGDLVVGTLDDPDPAGTAQSIDQWYARHADPWDENETRFAERFS